MKTLFIILIYFFSFHIINAQNMLFIGDKSYSATPSFDLEIPNRGAYHEEGLVCLIAKKGQNGIISLSVRVGTPVFIVGKAIIYLDNGNVITLIDRGIRDKVNEIATTIYYLSTEEINKMKESNINQIRFSLSCGKYCGSSEAGNFSATNHVDNNSLFQYKKPRIDVASLVKDLFENDK